MIFISLSGIILPLTPADYVTSETSIIFLANLVMVIWRRYVFAEQWAGNILQSIIRIYDGSFCEVWSGWNGQIRAHTRHCYSFLWTLPAQPIWAFSVEKDGSKSDLSSMTGISDKN